MGDYSRDTFKLTNVMHQVLSGESVVEPRHYVGVRLQQDVPVLDADWNELEDIRRVDDRLKLRYFFGEGIPSDDNGFGVGPVTTDNDLAIDVGIALVDGMIVINQYNDLTYLGQATALDETIVPLTTPVTDRNDLVYLDVWEAEIEASSPVDSDERLVNPAIGIETCNRMERRWLVRVAEGVDDIGGVPTQVGHSYMALARLQRQAGQSRISSSRIYDLRRIDLNIAKYLKIPLFVERGGDSVDSDDFAGLLDALRNILDIRLEEDQLYFDMTAFSSGTMTLFVSFQHLLQVCSTGALQARTRNLTNDDALQVVEALVAAQQSFLDVLSDHGISGPAKEAFVNDYQGYLGDVNDAGGESDLLGAYQAQQTLNAWLSADVNALPEGNVNIQFVAVDPAEPLVAGSPYDVFVQIASNVTSEAGSEIIDVAASLSSDLWQVTPESQEITLANSGGTQTISFQVIPNAANLTANLSVVATVRNNPTIFSPQLPLSLQIGVEPLAGGVLNYAGPPLNSEDRLEISSAALTNGFGTTVGFELHNNTAGNESYTVEWHIELTTGDETGWVPLAASPQSNVVNVNSESIGAVQCSIMGPTGGTVTGNIGILHVTLAATTESIDIEFICV